MNEDDFLDEMVPVCEVTGILKYSVQSTGNYELNKHVPWINDLPSISMHADSLDISTHNPALDQPFKPAQYSQWQKIINSRRQNNLITSLFLQIQNFQFLSNAYKFLSRLLHSYSITEKENELVKLNKYSRCSMWNDGTFRCIAWHPHCTKVAVALCTDSVRVYTPGCTSPSILSYRNQRNVTCIAWRPLCASDLAIGCKEGIFIWVLDPESWSIRPSLLYTSFLSKPDHKYVTSISWNQQGNLLVSGSLVSRTMYVWDVNMEKPVPLRKLGGGMPVLVTWSPCSEYIFAATDSTVFRIWNSVSWEHDRWSGLSSRVQCACWSPTGSVVLFICVTDSVVYAISMNPPNSGISTMVDKNKAAPVFDFKNHLDIISGEVVDMSWDSTGRYLAVMFRGINAIAIFDTVISVRVEITFRHLIKGKSDEQPCCIAFQNNVEDGANLTIGWSSGRVQYFPLVGNKIAGNVKNYPSFTSTTYKESTPVHHRTIINDRSTFL